MDQEPVLVGFVVCSLLNAVINAPIVSRAVNAVNPCTNRKKCLGNHEFDDGPDVLADFITNATFPVVATNVNFTREPKLANVSTLKKSITFNVGGLKIGIVGYTTPSTKVTSSPRNVTFSPEIPSVREETERLRKDGAQLVYAIGHSGFSMDKKVAKEVAGIDLVVGGHTNTFLHNGKQPSLEEIEGPYPVFVDGHNKKVPVVQAYAYTKYLGVLNIDYNDDGTAVERIYGNTILLDYSIEEDPAVLEVLKPWKKTIEERSKEIIGKTTVFLDGTANTRKKESNLANLITDAYIENYMTKWWKEESNVGTIGWTDTPIAIIQSGGIRSSINASTTEGIITYYDVASVLPFMEFLCRVTMKGIILRNAFEWSVAMYDITGGNYEGAFLQVSGLQVEYDMSKAIGERVVTLKARCGMCVVPHYREVDNYQNYSVLMSHYLAQGGDGFDMFRLNSTIEILDEIDTTIVLDYIKRKSPIYAGVEDRIVVRGLATHLFATSLLYLSIRTLLFYILI